MKAFKTNKYYLVLLLTLVGGSAKAQGYSEFDKPSSRAGPSKFAIVANYSMYSADFSSFTSTESNRATGTGYALGAELISPTSFLSGQYIMGLYYADQETEASPNSSRETVKMQSILMPVAWGVGIMGKLYVAVGAMAKYGIGKVERTKDGVPKQMSYNEYGLNPMGLDGLLIVRLYLNQSRTRKIFGDFKYAVGVTDRAIGKDDKWKDQEILAGIGFAF